MSYVLSLHGNLKFSHPNCPHLVVKFILCALHCAWPGLQLQGCLIWHECYPWLCWLLVSPYPNGTPRTTKSLGQENTKSGICFCWPWTIFYLFVYFLLKMASCASQKCAPFTFYHRCTAEQLTILIRTSGLRSCWIASEDKFIVSCRIACSFVLFGNILSVLIDAPIKQMDC